MTDTTTYRITIRARTGAGNNAGASLATAAHQLGLTAVQTITPSRLYFLHGRLSAAQASQLASELLADPVTEEFTAEEQRGGGEGEQGSRGVRE